ncbi:MAG TPA: winged helix-turn-helix domain-containing protein [Geobacterales bacterium]|nr:winged helix-turn-helix domain-containing protein [Geobacterales bacterium]
MELRGKTLQVYLYLLRKEEVGVREVQRALGLKSPSLAEYHLKKLEEMGLAKEQFGRYVLIKEVKPEFVRDLIKIGEILIPRLFLFAAFYLTLSIYFIYIFLVSGENFFSALPSIFLASAGIVFLIEGIRNYRKFYY